MNDYNPQFDQDQITENLARDTAKKNGTTIIKEFCNANLYHYLKNPNYWPVPYEDNAEDAKYSDVDLISFAGENPLSTYCKEISKQIQFPVNTALLHGLGIVSSAMNINFRYSYHGEEKPANLYVVTAQPPSTGKSGINSKLADPVREAYSRVAKTNRAYRAVSEKNIERMDKELASAKQEMAIKSLVIEIEKEQEFLNSKPNYVYSVDDVTPEALEALAGKQAGLFNVVSAEADAITVLLGENYGDGKGSANHNVFLKAWDYEHLSSARVSRDATSCQVYGSIVVIAQDTSIDSILNAGRSGRGIAERILMLREKSYLGERVHQRRKVVSDKAKNDYIRLIDNIVDEQEKIVLSVDDKGMDAIDEYRNNLEPMMKSGGEYSNNMIVGVVGKADKNTLKIAAVLHICDQWSGKIPKKSKLISHGTITQAIVIFNSLIETFVDAADSKGFTGQKTELTAIMDWFEKYQEKNRGKSITVRKMRDAIKRKPEFGLISDLTKKIRDEYLPELEARGVIVYNKQDIFLNPRL